MRMFPRNILGGHVRFAPLPRVAGIELRVSKFMLALLALSALLTMVRTIIGGTLALWPVWGVVLLQTALYPFHVLLHEMGHIAMARRHGQRARLVILHFLGGTTRFTGPLPTPGGEILLALAGTVLSLAVGAGALAVGWLTAFPVDDAPTVGIGAAWLSTAAGVFLATTAQIQISLGLINLLPMPLLDGGRVALAVGVKAKGPEIGCRWAENAALAGLVIGVALAAWIGSLLTILVVVYIYYAGRPLAEERRRFAWALAFPPSSRHGHAAVVGGGGGEMVTGGDFFFGTGSLSDGSVAGGFVPHRSDGRDPYSAWSDTDGEIRPAEAAGRKGWWSRRRERRAARKLAAAGDAARRERGELAELIAEEDRLLQKISAEGLDAISDAERKSLLRAAALRKSVLKN